MLDFRKYNGKRSQTAFGKHLYTSAVKLYDPFYNGKSYAVSLRSVGFVCLIEFIENFIKLFG